MNVMNNDNSHYYHIPLLRSGAQRGSGCSQLGLPRRRRHARAQLLQLLLQLLHLLLQRRHARVVRPAAGLR